MAADLQLLPINGELLYTFDWSVDVPAGVSMSAASYIIPAALEKFTQVDDLANKKSTVGFRSNAGAAKHGQTFVVEAKATLSNSEKPPKYLTIRMD
jgi:hypothetical protein